MSWKNLLRPASFRGIPFKVQDSDLTTGRRIVDFEYPERDIGSTNDLGRKKREYAITGYVIGLDYLDLKNNLIEACENENTPGELMHPFYGALEVRCKECKVRESMTSDGGMAIFSFIFTEAGLEIDPSGKIDTKLSVLNRAQAARNSSKSKFTRAINLTKQPGQVLAKSQSKINQAIDMLQNSPMRASAQEIASFTAQLTNIKSSSLALTQQPSKLADYLSDSIKGLQKVSGGPKESKKALMALSSFGSSDNISYSETPIGVTEKQNSEAFNTFIREQSVVSSVESIIDVEFDNFNDLENDKNEIVQIIEVLLDTFDDEFFISMGELKSTFIENFPDPEVSLPQISSISLNATLPSLVVAYQIYGDPRREAEIVKRNKISHPGFIPGGTSLEVLSE